VIFFNSPPRQSAQLRVTYVLFTLTFLVAPFYHKDNLGGEGLGIPFNAVIWSPALMLAGVGLLALLSTRYWVKPRYILLIVLFPLLITSGAFASGLERPGEWVIRLGVLIGGILLWFSLHQLQLKRRDIGVLLYILLVGFLVHSFIGLIQMLPMPILVGWTPESNGQPHGMFQQPNLQASMMSTAVAVALYLAVSPGFKNTRWPLRLLVFLTLALSVFCIVSSGSRLGVISLGLVIFIVFLSNHKRWRRRPLLTLLLCLAMGVGCAAGLLTSDGGLKAYNKLERLTEQGQDARPHIYTVAFDAWQRAPWIGHGIGSFQREFHNQRIEYFNPDRGEVIASQRFSHPHNELLFWAIEGGVVALIAIGLAVLAVALQIYRLGLQRGGLCVGLLLPIALHTQVEFPFYISTLHWLVLIVLLFVCFYPGATVKRVGLSPSASTLLLASSIIMPSLLTVFLMNSLLSQTGIMQYVKFRGSELHHLRFALNNLYFKEQGEYIVMRSTLLGGMSSGAKEEVEIFVNWAENYLSQKPDIQLFRNQAVAYQYLGRFDEAKSIINHASSIYPENPQLSDALRRINAGELLEPTSAAGNLVEND